MPNLKQARCFRKRKSAENPPLFGIKIKTENITDAGKCGSSLVAECRGVVGPVPKDGTLADCVEGVDDFLVEGKLQGTLINHWDIRSAFFVPCLTIIPSPLFQLNLYIMPSWSSYLPCEVSDGILVVLPHLERGVLAALLVKRLQDVAVYIGGEALDHPFLLLDLLSSVASPHFPSFIHTYPNREI